MAVIVPLRAVFFDKDKVGDLNSVVTPPYDVLNAFEANLLRTSNQYNMVRLDLPKEICREELSPDRYSGAAATFNEWMRSGVLIKDFEHCLYYSETHYSLADGTDHVRKGFIALVELHEFCKQIVKPHEKTYDSVIADRLALMDHCRAQFSQVFSLYLDRDNSVVELLEGEKGEVHSSVTDSTGCSHTLYRLNNPAVIKTICNIFKDKSLYIADGHHRYTTALAYRKKILEQGVIPPDHPANYVMMYLCPMEDPGLTILPTHRLLQFQGEFSEHEFRNRFASYFDIREYSDKTPENAYVTVLKNMKHLASGPATDGPRSVFGIYLPALKKWFTLQLKKEAMRKHDVQETCVNNLDVTLLSEIIFKNILGVHDKMSVETHRLHFISDTHAAIQKAEQLWVEEKGYSPILFLLNPTTVEQVRNVADAKLTMPHKSTFFYPKVITGLIMNHLDEKDADYRTLL
jgi:uncharacterized protein (DUF1015 family)